MPTKHHVTAGSPFIEQCLPSAANPPYRLHDKHDGFNIVARRDLSSVRLYTRSVVGKSAINAATVPRPVETERSTLGSCR
jgi:hypothetical protein